jgi:hypothetical protein
MSTLQNLSKAVLVVETALEKEVLGEIQRLGVKGYTCVYCFGYGRHPVYEDPFMPSPQVRIETITTRQIGEAILKYIAAPQFANRPAIAYLEAVEVLAADRFL